MAIGFAPRVHRKPHYLLRRTWGLNRERRTRERKEWAGVRITEDTLGDKGGHGHIYTVTLAGTATIDNSSGGLTAAHAAGFPALSNSFGPALYHRMSD